MVYLFLADGFEEIEALCALDFLRRADIETLTVGVSGKSAMGSHGIEVVCDITEKELDKSKDFDMVILPGGMPGSSNLDKSQVVSEIIDIAVKGDKFICAICAAPFILGKRGLLRGKRATCYPGFENELDGATLVNEGVVRDGKIITGRAMGSAHDFALEIIEALAGNEKREALKKAVLY
ncbi:MAG: DJ-1/PfpI family protein [Clostridia bacterium]|nr:DJ-1/PfpI family protein [Clostridia bacterium]